MRASRTGHGRVYTDIHVDACIYIYNIYIYVYIYIYIHIYINYIYINK